MAFDPYMSCPCGSGKKFKWCCQPIHEQLAKIFALDAKGQHEAALRAIDDIIKQYPESAEIWGRKAQLLFQLERPEDAETALQKAFELNPRYAFGFYLQGKFRQFEGEVLGALALFRKAVEAYDSSASEMIADIYSEIAEAENLLNRPLATRAALQFVERNSPNSAEVRQAIQAYADQPHLPLAARRQYSFMSPSSVSDDQQKVWQQALEKGATGKLSDAAAAFEELTRKYENEPAAWYNLALCRAWAGQNSASIEALAHYVELEADESRAADAWTLAEVLRFGHGMEDQAECVRHLIVFPIYDRGPLVRYLQELAAESRLVEPRTDEQNDMFTALILEKVQALVASAQTKITPKLAAHMNIHGNLLRLWSTNRASLDSFAAEMSAKLGSALGSAATSRGPAGFGEIFTEVIIFPIGFTDAQEASQRSAQEFTRFFEEKWIHRPLKSLNQIAAIDAANHTQLRKKLRGVIQFLEQTGATMSLPYDFNRLRHKLGLSDSQQAAGSPGKPDIDGMSAAELSALKPDDLNAAEAEQAYLAALKLDARELAASFARSLVARPPEAAKPDRLPWYNQLVQTALREDDFTAALNFIDEGESFDCTHNQGKRRNDFEIRRAQVHARSGAIEQAEQVFDSLIARDPEDLHIRGTAAEAMLSARQAARALRFAEEGLTQAREKNKRDSEEYFMELVSAAQKQ